MASLIYFLIFAGLFALMMRYGCGAHVLGHRHSHGTVSDGAHAGLRTAKDPVCGMIVEIGKAETNTYRGQTYYFCSTRCRERFETAPEKFVAKTAGPSTGMEKSHGSHRH